MAWLVDTCVLIDLAEADPRFGAAAARHLQARLHDGLLISPLTYVELAPVFQGSREVEDEFLAEAGIRADEPWTRDDTRVAHQAWWAWVERRRRREVPKRPIADLLIGAMALRFQGLITRNGGDFASLFPTLRISDPMRRAT